MIRQLKYSLTLIVPLVVFVSLWFSGIWAWFAVAFTFGLIPFFELFTDGSTKNLSKEEEAVERKQPIYDFFIYMNLPFQYLLLGLFVYRIGFTTYNWWEMIGIVLAMGISCGVLGINCAHELGHRTKNYEQNMSKSLLLTTLYMHFFIEHNRGHHKNIATPLDPATSRYGENIYSFFIRSVSQSYRSAWELEAHRLQKIGKKNLSWDNEMLRFQVIQFLFTLTIFLISWKAGIAFLFAATIGALLLETINYVEHYGLLRNEISPGRYEKVKPHHSWNSNHPLGRILLLELTRHSDHHYNSGRKYQILRHFDNSPQMPTGYPGMVLLSLVPPLWFRVMNQRVLDHKVNIDDNYQVLETAVA